MNYAKIREAQKKKMIEKKSVLASMDGKARTEYEQHLLEEAKKEAGEEDKAPGLPLVDESKQADGVKAVEQQKNKHQGQQRRG